MPYAKLTIDLPEAVWTGEVARECPSATFRVLSAVSSGDAGFGLLEIESESIPTVLDTIEGRLGPLEPPVTIVVGEVAQWGGVIDWFEASGEEGEDFPTQEEIDREDASSERVPVLPNPAFTA